MNTFPFFFGWHESKSFGTAAALGPTVPAAVCNTDRMIIYREKPKCSGKNVPMSLCSSKILHKPPLDWTWVSTVWGWQLPNQWHSLGWMVWFVSSLPAWTCGTLGTAGWLRSNNEEQQVQKLFIAYNWHHIYIHLIYGPHHHVSSFHVCFFWLLWSVTTTCIPPTLQHWKSLLWSVIRICMPPTLQY